MTTTIATPFELLLCEGRFDRDKPYTRGDCGMIDVDPTKPEHALADLWCWYNRGSGREVKFQHRSLMVSDVIILGETCWIVESFGFATATPPEVKP